jgi:azurin
MKPGIVLVAMVSLMPAVLAEEGPAVFHLRTLPGLMKYDQSTLRVKPGQAVEVTLQNDDQLPHNLVVLTQAGVFMEVAQKAWELGEKGLVQQWIPEDSRVLAHTAMVDPGKSGKLVFTAPATEGALEFVCTFPGHAMIMNGKVLVSAAPPGGLRELTCMIYKGSWDRLPDFLALPQENKVATDEVNDGLISLGVTEMRDHFGIVFNGLLEVPTSGEYTFHLGSDDGSRLVIDNQEVIRHDGIHAHSERKKKVALEAGLRRVRVEYFEQAGEQSLTLAWSGPGFERTWLSKEQQSPGEEFPEIVLAASDGRPVIYRGFLSPNGGSRRLIAVGAPEQLHYAFDQDQLRLALLWKGAFLDAGRHWTGRGAGDITPLGFAVVERPVGEELAVLGDASTSWPTPDDNGRARHAHFRGYRLDASGAPTFRYTVQGVEVEDAIRPAGRLAEATDALVRTISLHAAAPVDGLHFRLASGQPAEPGPDGSWRLGGTLTATIEGGGSPVSRDGQVVMPITFENGRARLVVTYRWL